MSCFFRAIWITFKDCYFSSGTDNSGHLINAKLAIRPGLDGVNRNRYLILFALKSKSKSIAYLKAQVTQVLAFLSGNINERVLKINADNLRLWKPGRL